MKQSIILVLVAALCLSLFAGCGSAPAQSPSGEAGDSGYDSITLTLVSIWVSVPLTAMVRVMLS